MNSRPLVIITTRLPPHVCGIGTYSWLLHQHWTGGHSRVEFLVIDGAAESEHSSVSQFDGKSELLFAALDRIGPADVFLHYAGRAYHRFGIPRWLPSVLAKWKQKFPASRLLVLFHEMPGEMPITSRHYWIDMLNRRIIARLARLADVIVTNTAEHIAKLEKISGRKDAHLVPVPSNIHAPENTSGPRARTEAVVFGLPFGRAQTLQLFDRELRSWRESRCLTKLHIIGPPAAENSVPANAGVVLEHGMLPPSEVSAILLRAQFGLSNATSSNWSKSAVFMAYASHGCAVVGKMRMEAEPLCFTVGPEEVSQISDVDLSTRTAALKNWYERNASWKVVGQQISKLLSSDVHEEALR